MMMMYSGSGSSSNKNANTRTRTLSEDIPKSVQMLLDETPQDLQSILVVAKEKTVPDTQVNAENNFLNSKNNRLKFEESKTAYDFQYLRKLLQDAPIQALYVGRKSSEVSNRPITEICHRQYEEEFLREAKRNERQCANGENCEGKKITTADEGFILREFLKPSQYKKFIEGKGLPDNPQLCIMCQRATVAKLYINMRADKVHGNGLIADYRNFCNVSGEYVLSQCLLPTTQHNHVGLFDPVILHCRKNYTPARINGIRYYKQEHYDKPDSAPTPFLN